MENARKRKAEEEIGNDTKRVKYGQNIEPKTAMRLTLCLGCGEYLCQPTAHVEYCFEDHLCEIDQPDFEKFKKVIEIIESKIGKQKVPEQEKTLAAAVPRPPPPPPPQPMAPSPPPPPTASLPPPAIPKTPKLQSEKPASGKTPDSSNGSFVDELKTLLKKKFM